MDSLVKLWTSSAITVPLAGTASTLLIPNLDADALPPTVIWSVELAAVIVILPLVRLTVAVTLVNDWSLAFSCVSDATSPAALPNVMVSVVAGPGGFVVVVWVVIVRV